MLIAAMRHAHGLCLRIKNGEADASPFGFPMAEKGGAAFRNSLGAAVDTGMRNVIQIAAFKAKIGEFSSIHPLHLRKGFTINAIPHIPLPQGGKFGGFRLKGRGKAWVLCVNH